VRQKRTITSELDGVPGVGPTRREALLKRFGSVAQIKAASAEEIAAVKGMTAKLAAAVKATLG
jgi:excinuclease ABC subunit C